jgi:glycosyltransferase involved in cell wall biosynthesis
VFPLFGRDLGNGSEHYQYMLSRALVRLGVEVDVFTTRSKHFRPSSAFSHTWVDEFEVDRERTDGIEVHRFPVTVSAPPALGHAISRLMFRRWEREEARYGVMLKGSRNLTGHLHRRALDRPALYDWLALGGRGPWSLPLLSRVWRTIKDYDVVLTGFVPFALAWQVSRIATLFRKPLVVLPLFHPEDLYHHFRAFYRCLARADAVLAQTAYSAELFRRLCPGAQPVVVGAGVDARALLDPRISGERFRAKYGLGRQKLVLFVGRKEPSKRYDLALEAVGMIDDPRVTLALIGADVDGRPITSTRARYLGKVAREDLLDAYDACDVFVLPSEHESFGIVFLEAWMRGKPVIGNAYCGPVASIIRDGENGYLVRSATELAGRIRALLADPGLGRALGHEGSGMVRRDYTWDAVGGKVRDLYARVATGAAREAEVAAELVRLAPAGR